MMSISSFFDDGQSLPKKMPTALSHACSINNIDAVKMTLKDEKIDVNEDMGIAIREATKVGNLEMVCLLVKHGANPRVIEDSPLRIAAEYGHTILFQYFRDVGAKIDDFCLRVAIKNGFIDIVKAILSSPSHSLVVTEEMIAKARENGHRSMVKMLDDAKGMGDA